MAVNDNPGILQYTRLFKSPYFYGSRQHGVQKYSVYNHHYHPRYYRDPVEEYWQLLEGVTMWDVGGAERQVEITGPDAFEFTNMLTPRDLNKCNVEQCKYAFITNAQGGIINDPVLLRLARTTSGSRWPTATCCSGPRASPTTRGWTSRSGSPTWARCRCRGPSPRRS
jgi:aminomethyltransferase